MSTPTERLVELIRKARELRGEADRLAADLKRDSDYDGYNDRWKAESMADAFDRAVKIGEGRATGDGE